MEMLVPRVSQMLDAQVSGGDPFQQAQQQTPLGASADNAEYQGFNQTMAKMFELPGQNPQKPMPQQQSPLAAPLLFQPGNAQEKAQYDQSKLPNFLNGLGVDSKNLAMNQLGRVQLVGRLKNKYGQDYQNNPDALQALSLFDEASKTDGTSMQASISTGERTLKAPPGGA